MKYRDFSAYWVMDEIKSGKTVYALDRKEKAVAVVNFLSVDEAMEAIKLAEKNPTRFEFWTEEQEESENA